MKDNEIEFIRLKIDWYKSQYPWCLALIAVSVAFYKFTEGNNPALIASIVFFVLALLSVGQAAVALIHRLEEQHEVI